MYCYALYSPTWRGTKENINGLTRQHFSKGAVSKNVSNTELRKVRRETE